MNEKRATDVFRFRCLCGKEASVARVVDSGEPCVMHELPTCATFDRNDAPDYLKAVREKRAIQ